MSPVCAAEIRRVMLERSHTVDLPPSIEADCLQDLALVCSEKTEKNDVCDMISRGYTVHGLNEI